MKKLNKRGIAPVIQQGGQALLILALFLILIGVVFTFGSKFMQDERDSAGTESCSKRTDTRVNYNTTSNVCYNTSSTVAVGTPSFSVANDSLGVVVSGAENTDSYQSVAGIGVVLFILIAIIGYFIYRNRMA